MELLMFLLLSPAIFAQNYQRSPEPNNEPFLPIYPVYPYSPKLIKRGTDRDVGTAGTQESYNPKQDSRESYASTFGGNFQRDPYASPYSSFSQPPAPQLPPFSSPFSSSPFGSSAFGSSPFSSSPFGSSPFGAASFNSGTFNANPNNFLNPYASAYQNSPFSQNPQIPPTPFAANTYPNFYQPPVHLPNFYHQYPQSYPSPGPNYPGKNEKDNDDDDRKGKKSGRGRYKEVDDEDLNRNQFTDGANYLSQNSKDLDGQSASLDYPATAYIKPHQVEQFMRQTLAKILAQNVAQQGKQIQYSSYDTNPNSPNQNTVTKDNQNYVPLPNVIAKAGLSYLVNPTVITKPSISPGQAQQTQAIIGNNPRYAESQYSQKPGLYISSVKADRNQGSLQSTDYSDFEDQSSQVDQNYQASTNQEQSQRKTYKPQNLVTPTPQPSSYQYSSYHPTPIPKPSGQRNLDSVSINFSNKQKGKE